MIMGIMRMRGATGMNQLKVIILAVFMVAFVTASSEAGWLIYHEPELKGTILDIETKKPIEGAVVVAVYKKATLGLGAGSISSIINVRETLSDKDGLFHIPSYTSIIQPFSWQIPSSVIIFKPGYASLEVGNWHFIGKEIESQEGSWPWTKDLKYRLSGRGIVEVPKLKTREEKRQAWMDASIFGADVKSGDLPLLYKMVNEESKIWF
jgi:hypothetical protein